MNVNKLCLNHCWDLYKITVANSTRSLLGPAQVHCWDQQSPLLGPAQVHCWDQHKSTVGTCQHHCWHLHKSIGCTGTGSPVMGSAQVSWWDGAREIMESAEFAILLDQYNVQLRNLQRFAGGNGDFRSFQIAGSYFLSLSYVVNESRRRWRKTVAVAGACLLR